MVLSLPIVWTGSVLGPLILSVLCKTSFLVLLSRFCLFEVVVWAIWSTFIYPHWFSPLKNVPMPQGNHWLLGHGLKLLREPQGQPSRQWLSEVEHDGVVRYLTFFNRERLVIYSPQALSDILVTNCYSFQKPSFLAEPMRVILGNGLLVSEGEEHKVQKRGLMPAFTAMRIKSMYPIFLSKTCEVVRQMTTAVGVDGVAEMDVISWASRSALDIIGLAGLGKDFGAIQDDENPLVRTYKAVFNVTRQQRVMFLLSGFLPAWLLRYLPLQHNREFTEASDYIRQLCRETIQEKRDNFATGGDDQDADILSTIIRSGRFADESLVDQIMTLLAAGHETTESSLIWAIYALARHPEMQQRLREEVRQKLPPLDCWTEDTTTSFDIESLAYLHAVCNEALRILTPVRLTMREASEDTILQGLPIRRGTKVIISSCATNTDTSLWGPDAADFNPDRWLARNEAGDLCVTKGGGASSNYAMVSFSQGYRRCIGQEFAKAEFACLLAGWIGRFEFRLQDADVDGVKVKNGITAKPAGSMRMLVRVVTGF